MGWACLGGPRGQLPGTKRTGSSGPKCRVRDAPRPRRGVTPAPRPTRALFSGTYAPPRPQQRAHTRLTCRDMAAKPGRCLSLSAGFPGPGAQRLLKGQRASARRLPLVALPGPAYAHWSLAREGGAGR